MAEQSVKPKSNTKYKVLGITIAGTVVATVSYFLFSSLKKEDVPAEAAAATPKVVVKKATSKSTSSTTTTTPSQASVVTTSALVATMTQATAAKLAEALRRATYIRNTDDYGKNWGLLLGSLALIKNIKDYTLVNNIFLQVDLSDRLLNNTVSMSIVSKTMAGFGKYNAYKIGLTKEFIRIGLKLTADGKWSLNGLGSL